MAIFRNVNMSFWTDTKVVDDYTPEDKYFMLYAMTNQYTNIIGCYEISIRQISNDLGYNKEVVENLLKRFKEIHKTVDYDFETKELLIVNWHKYNWSNSPKLDAPLKESIEKIKSDKFYDKLATLYNKRQEEKEEKDMVLIPYRYGIDTTITITNTISNTISNTNIDNNINDIEEIINRLNQLAGTNYRSTGESTKRLLKNLLKDYTKEEILEVVDKMCYKWMNTKKGEKDMSEYLRPSTLFRKSNFENYLGMNVQKKEWTTDDIPLNINF